MSALGTVALFGVAPVPTRRFTVAEYHRMIETRILADDDPIELREGWIVPKMPHNAAHDGTIQKIHKRLGRRLPSGWDLRGQSAITTGDSEPEPDLAAVRGDETTYIHRKPQPADVGLAIEVAESSLNHDRNFKGRVYARAGIPHYWIVNLIDNCVEAYSDPDSAASPPAYRSRTDYRPGDQIALVLDGQTVATLPVADLLP
jgi:Uma2 family endonuclease